VGDRKDRIIGELERGFGGRSFIVLEHDGVPAGAFGEIRARLRPEAVLRVAKGTLGRIAAARAGLPSEVTVMIRGPVAIAFVDGDIAATARLLAGSAPHGLSAKGGLDGARALSAGDVGALARIGSRPLALGRAARSMRAPLERLAAALRARERGM
jgi:ribosomal protein L10